MHETPRMTLPHWLPVWRLDLYARLLLLLYLLLPAIWLVTDFSQAPGVLGRDFIAFWAAAKLTSAQSALAVYQPEILLSFSRTAVPDALDLPWFYPPTYLLMVQWLRPFSYPEAFAFFTGGSIVLYGFAVYALCRSKRMTCYALALPFVFITAQYGQNGLLLAVIVAAAARMHSRPFISGALLGLLCIKPHLFIGLGLLLITCASPAMWGGALLSSLVLAVSATLMFSPAIWVIFFETLDRARLLLEQGVLPWWQMGSLFSGLRQWGVDVTGSHALQLIWGLLGLLMTWRVIRSTRRWELHWAASIAGGLMVSPFLYQYDMVLLAIPLVLLVMSACKDGLPGGQVQAFLVVAMLPLLDYLNLTHLNWVLPAIVLLMCWRQSRCSSLPGSS